MEVVDTDYKFIHVDVGCSGAGSDGCVFDRTDFQEMMADRTHNLHPPEPLPNGDPTKEVPYFIVGEEAFPLQTWLMKPIPQRNLAR